MTTTDFTFPTCLIVTRTTLSTITTVRPRRHVVEARCNIDVQNKTGFRIRLGSLLFLSVHEGHTVVVQFLLSAHCIIVLQSMTGFTAQQAAHRAGYVGIVTLSRIRNTKVAKDVLRQTRPEKIKKQ